MTQIVRAAHRLGACPILRHGCGAGLVPHPAVEAFAERGATGTPEQPLIELADCGKSQAAELLAGLAAALGAAAAADSDEGCVYVFAEQDQGGCTRWVTASQLPAAWPQSTPTGSAPRGAH